MDPSVYEAVWDKVLLNGTVLHGQFSGDHPGPYAPNLVSEEDLLAKR